MCEMDRCWLPIWVGFLCCLGNTAIAQDLASDLIELPFEDLVNMEVVASTAGKRELKLEDTPAPLFVIGQEDIRRSGVRSIPDLLSMCRMNDLSSFMTSTGKVRK